MSRGVRPGQIEIDNDELRGLRIALPPLDEQRRIADFLDAETTRIDRLMGSQLRALNLLEERANARILKIIGQSLLVTPAGAPITPMRRVIQKLTRPVMTTNEIITAFRDGQVTSRAIRRSEGYTLSVIAEPQGQGVETGDIVVHGLDGFAGAIGDSEASGNCSPVYHVCIPVDDGNSAFYGRLLRLLALDDYLTLYGGSARERAVDFRNWNIFARAPIPQVEPSVQHEIGNSITRIRPLREEVMRFNERLTERRQALVTAAVTGQIDVTTAGELAPAGGVV
jgi:type I restriction enzyme S subunit